MGILSKLFRSSKAEPSTEGRTEEGPTRACVHLVLAPQWDSAADIGNEAKAARWVCAACGDSFTPAEQTALRTTEAERLRAVLEADGHVGDGD